jgi:hypothetical protein
MDNDRRCRRTIQVGFATAMVVPHKRPLPEYLPSMHGQHTVPVIGQNNIFHLVVESCLAGWAHAVAYHYDGRWRRPLRLL